MKKGEAILSVNEGVWSVKIVPWDADTVEISADHVDSYVGAVNQLSKYADIEELRWKAPSGDAILKACIDITKLLLEKNVAYGNSALNPVRIFSKASTTEQLLVRIDDKLNRLKNGSEYPGEDTVSDLIGYLILLKVQMDSES